MKTTQIDSTLAKQIENANRSALKVRVSFSIWDGKLASDKVASIAAASEHADKSSIEGKVIALTRESQKAVIKIKDQINRLLKDDNNTRPWEDGGWRLCLAAKFPALKAQIDKLIQEYRDAITVCIDRNYDALKASAKQRLNGLLEERFPSKDALLEKYDVRFFFDRPNFGGDFRVPGISNGEADAIRAERDNHYRDLINTSNRAMVAEIAATVATLHSTLADPEKRFNGIAELGFPIFDNVRSMCNGAEELNIFCDQKVTDTIKKVRETLDKIDPELVKTDKLARKDAAASVKTVLDDLASF